ncbi:type IV toxin-antitoxin system AbiEi family antitoxin [Pontiella desulfatans]|nr:type IV toxin-antitoxin system AbiEi family antitoxin [Pontiella desulfatans]
MDSQSKSKINQMLQNLVPGTVLTPTWLAGQGVSRDLALRYVTSGWLERVGRGAYQRRGDSVDWQGAVHTLQTQLGLTVHVAGLSALQLKGLGHYLSMGKEASVLLVSDGAERLPAWFSGKEWGAEIVHRCVQLFDFSENLPLTVVEHKGFSVRVSPPERAAFEMIYCVDGNSAFDHARTVFDGLGALRPQEVQKLLEACRSVRVKRLFLWMARDCAHPWLKHVDPDRVDLGSGKRVVYDGGELDRELLITVPRRKEDADV